MYFHSSSCHGYVPAAIQIVLSMSRSENVPLSSLPTFSVCQNEAIIQPQSWRVIQKAKRAAVQTPEFWKHVESVEDPQGFPFKRYLWASSCTFVPAARGGEKTEPKIPRAPD